MEVKGVDQWQLDFRQAAILRVTTLLQLAQMLVCNSRVVDQFQLVSVQAIKTSKVILLQSVRVQGKVHSLFLP